MEFTYSLNTLYFLVSGVLVMFMAVGFTMLEAGSVRIKNVNEILLKNVALYSIASISFTLIGYEIAYGTPNEIVDHAPSSDVFFQMVFAATAMSVVSGAAAERKKLWSFLIFAGIFTAVIYPVVVEATWGGGYLSKFGFSDFAGSGIVHMAGGAAALAAVLLIGPRRGKYDTDGKPRAIHGSNMAQVTLGTLILWFGWFGFNGGSQLSIEGIENANAVGDIFINTNIAAAAGLVAAMLLSKIWLGKTALNATLNGALAGLVVITADPLTPSPQVAALYGALGGLIAPFSMSLLEKWGIDDPVGAISVHGVAGVAGLLLVPILTDVTVIAQVVGTGAIFSFVFISSLLVWTVLKYTIGIRVGSEEEKVGSDLWETGTKAYPEFMK